MRVTALVLSNLLFVASWSVWLAGCATTSAEQAGDSEPYLEGPYAEDRELPAHPQDEDLDLAPGVNADETAVEAATKGQPAPMDGIIVSESRAARDALYRIRYKELRTTYEADRSVWRVHRTIYEKQIEMDNDRIRELTPPPPTWWDQHGTAVLIGSSALVGLVAGAGLTVGVGYALYGTQITP